MASPDPFKHHRTALIDGDILVWRASAFAHDHQQDEMELLERIITDTARWARLAFCEDVIVCLSGNREDNFRRDAWPLYKSNRPDERPEFHRMSLDIMRENFQVFQRDALEADGCMGLLATLGTVDNPVMVTVDKDLRTVRGWHFNPDKDDFPVWLDQRTADRAFYMQWLTGDSTDGYKGIKGMGPKKAEKVFAGIEWTYEVNSVLRTYADNGHTYEYALSMARCARILTNEWWDSEAKAPILWSPLLSEIEGLEEWAELTQTA